jgi:hypothetical protein
MGELTKFLNYEGGLGDQLTNWEAVLAMAICLACMVLVTFTYRYTHRGVSYSASYVQSLVLMGLVTTLIMIVIGSNIARAFSLVGALSIIRFRNAVKETRDLGYIFFAMAVAMACGTRFYALALVGTSMIGSVVVAMHITNFGASRIRPERLLTVYMPPEVEAEAVLEPVFRELFDAYSLVTLESVRQGVYTAVVYSVRPRDNITSTQVLDAIAKVNGNLKVTYNCAEHTEEL